MTTHTLEPTAATLHGFFSRDLPPALTIDPGDRVRARTLDAGWGAFEQPDPFTKPRKFEPHDWREHPGHALCGPIAVRGARAGDSLIVRVIACRPGAWGWSGAGGFPTPINTRLGVAEGEQSALRWKLDADAGIAISEGGRRLHLRPFLGVLGTAPAEPGRHSTIPPRPTGGNIDCRELTPGSELHLPIAVDGALFSLGDGHAVQGDGEVGQVAIECPMESVVELGLGPPLAPAMPLARTPEAWITFGFHEDLDEAAMVALDGMLHLMGRLHGADRKEALSLASLLVDLRITQMVNRVRGVHAVLRHDALG